MNQKSSVVQSGVVANIDADFLRESRGVGKAHAKAHSSPLSHNELVSPQRPAAQAGLAVDLVQFQYGLTCGEIWQAGTARHIFRCRDPDVLGAESSLMSSASPDGRDGREPGPDGWTRLAGAGLFDTVPTSGADRGADPVLRIRAATEPACPLSGSGQHRD